MENENEQTTKKYKIGLTLLALGLVLFPILIIRITILFGFPIIYIFIIISPIAGMILGVISLKQGRKKIGIFGMILSITAIALPVIVVISIIVLFIGVATNTIYLM
ncbi:MAG: hypothetical protein FWD47_10590 [Treponema sp.]|nr:hypothetical protein [Treponema sp.]